MGTRVAVLPGILLFVVLSGLHQPLEEGARGMGRDENDGVLSASSLQPDFPLNCGSAASSLGGLSEPH